jgi:endoglucanase
MCRAHSIIDCGSFLAVVVGWVLCAGCSGSASKCPRGWTNGIAPLHTEGRFFKDPTGNVVILRGVAIVDPVDLDNSGGTMNTDRLLSLLSDANQGFYVRVVRITVLPKIYKIYGTETYFNRYLEPAVKQATALGLYAIVDWHEIDDAEAVADETTAFWKFMAPKFADYSNVLYEVFNEPTNFNNTSWTHWKQYAQPWVDQIRKAAPDRIILIGGPYWSQQIGGAASDPFVGNNLAYVGHIYPEGVLPGGLLDDTGPIAQAASAQPVFITEWGFNATATQTSFGQPLKTFIEAHGLSWTAWCASGIWSPMMFDANWNLLVNEDQMGGFAKAWLAERKDQDQPEKASPGQCPTMTPSNRPPSSAPDASPFEVSQNTSPDVPVADARICPGTPNDIGSEACPAAPFAADYTACHDVGRGCEYSDCGTLVSCTCRDETGEGRPIWQCQYLLY